MNTDITLNDAAEFIWQEAEFLDYANYDNWLDLWKSDGLYIIPINPESNDFANELNIVYDDTAMRKMRVSRLAGGFAISAAPAARTIRLVSRFVIAERTNGIVTVRSAMHLTEEKFGRQRTFCANLEHHLTRDDSGIRIDKKIVRLVNSDGVLTPVSYLF